MIKRGYEFLDTIHAKAVQSEQVKETAMGEFVLAIRKDLLSRHLTKITKLGSDDFWHLEVDDGACIAAPQ